MICISFDTDHCDDARMAEFLGEFEIPGAATFFCTQKYESIDPRHEVGPHAVLEWGADWNTALEEARNLFPDAEGFRAHGCLHSHGLAVELQRQGYRYVSSHDQFGRSSIAPHREVWGLWHAPIYYMDTFDISFARYWPDTVHEPFNRELLERAVSGDALFVFAFHPIHLLLNSASVEGYLDRRDRFKAGEPIEELRFDGYGPASYFRDLTSLMNERGVAGETIAAAVNALADPAVV